MRGDSTKPGIPSDDIDLIALLHRTLLFFRTNKWIFIFSVVAGLAAGYMRYRSLPTVYKSRLFLQSLLLTNQNDIQLVYNWNNLLKSNDHKSLASIFNTPEPILKKLKQMKADEIQKIFTSNNPNGFIVDVFVTDVLILPDIQKGIVYGFDNGEYVKERLSAKKRRLQELIGKTNEEICMLDSTKKVVENILAGRSTSRSSVIVDVSGISRQLVELNEKLLNTKEELRFTSAVQVLQGFSQAQKPAGPSFLVWMSIGFLAGLCAGYFIALSRSVSQSLKDRLQAHKK